MKKTLVMATVVLAVFLAVNFVFAQDNTITENTQPSQANMQITPSNTENAPALSLPQTLEVPAVKDEAQQSKPDVAESDTTQWLWGQVDSVDLVNKELVVNYLDYEGDTEKKASIGIDDKTKFVNIQGLPDLKAQDAVSVDYVIGADGKLTAKNINLEKPEEPAAQAVQAEPANEPAVEAVTP